MSNIERAIEQTRGAEEAMKEIENILKYRLNIADRDVWETLKDKSGFSKPKPQPARLLVVPEPPKETDLKYQVSMPKPKRKSFWQEIFGLFNYYQYLIELERWEAEEQNVRLLYKNDYDEWLKQKGEILKKNAELEEQYQNELKQWEAEEQEFLKKQKDKKDKNDKIDKRKEQYLNKIPDAVVDYCKLVLSISEYPDYFPQEFDVDYTPETKILIVDYSLPSVDSIPKLKEVKYIKSRDELVEVFHTESFINKLYDSLVYQITLRTIHELYESDAINALDSIVFNGWVKSIDKATGKEVNACILSVQANRQEFLSINLTNVDPKSCFRHLKGVGSSQLHSLTPVAPILNISREDKRFISSYAVADELDESMNLAAMDWEDFEHLIRELFEKEFAQYGGEVKITRASRDHGVDAVAFDPDPIRGGKIVIQAKRYTNTVGVSAVRDLYGTVMNEGATKGILVTTADYGPDSYEFAKGKPLTLMSGSNLLHLLEKHGHRAKIDLKAAKEILSEREKDMDG